MNTWNALGILWESKTHIGKNILGFQIFDSKRKKEK